MSEDAGAPQENPEKDRSEWVTGDELIDRLQQQTGRGTS